MKEFLARADDGREPLWKLWWLAGIPVWTAAGLLIYAAEELRLAGHHGAGAWLDLLRLAVYFVWLRFSWRCSRNVAFRPWTYLARAALAAGLVLMVIV